MLARKVINFKLTPNQIKRAVLSYTLNLNKLIEIIENLDKKTKDKALRNAFNKIKLALEDRR